MSGPALRVLALLELLQTHRRMSGADLSARLGVDRRTLRRYIAMLEDMGIPITAERGRYGSYMLVPGFKLPPMMFTDEEALAISLGLAAARGVGLGQDSAAIDTVQAKLERVMPPNLRPRMRTATETVQLELSHRQSKGEGAALATMTSAAQARRRVHLAYRSAKAEDTERDFDPYGLVYRWGNWYVSGLCHLRGGLRSLRLDRIREVRMLDIEFARPADFDAARHLAFSMAHIQRAHPVKVLLKTDLGAATEELGTDIGVLEPCTDGVWLHSSTDDIEWFARQLARLPFRLRIMEPEALAQALRTHAQWLLEA